MVTNHLEFEQAAERAIIDGLGASTLETFRQLVDDWGPGLATFEAANVMELSDNDKKIFGAVARKLWRERATSEAESST